MRAFNLHFLGRFGNCVGQYLFARAYCERHGLTLHTDAWVGEEIFNIEHPRANGSLPRKDENTLQAGDADVSYRSYSQQQKCIIYTKRQAQSWLRFRPEILEKCAALIPGDDAIVAHRRVGDYPGYAIYPVVSVESYRSACWHYGLDETKLRFVTEESPLVAPDLPDRLAFVPDFIRLVYAPTLLRGNSTFSWVAGLLSDGLVLSPKIDGLRGGEHDCPFVAGNHPKFVEGLEFVTDLYVNP